MESQVAVLAAADAQQAEQNEQPHMARIAPNGESFPPFAQDQDYHHQGASDHESPRYQPIARQVFIGK